MTDFATALKTLWVHGDQHMPGLLAGIIAAAPTVFPKYGLTTPLLVVSSEIEMLSVKDNWDAAEPELLFTDEALIKAVINISTIPMTPAT